MRLRRLLIAAILTGCLGAFTGFAAALAGAGLHHRARPAPAVAASPLAHVQRVPAREARAATARRIPVLVYHEMDNDCAATAATCARGHDYESVSLDQFRAEMAWMYARGYHTVTLAQYLEWLGDKRTLLPPKPFLITVDNGIWDFLSGSQATLYHYRYTATAFLVTGFANAASGQCAARIDGTGVQPGCPETSEYWDATWAQIRSLPPAVYGFGIEAGASGHYEQDYGGACYEFDACRMPGETAAHYEARVRTEMSSGIATLTRQLGTRFDARAWVVPYSDLGYPCEAVSCAGEQHTGPGNWLIHYAARHFAAAFVQDYYRNGKNHERFRYEVHSTTTLTGFAAAIRHYTKAGAFRWA
jgi:peptidoglycan/xylan/chitin deacetylase (PgdA/CDA1 family)